MMLKINLGLVDSIIASAERYARSHALFLYPYSLKRHKFIGKAYGIDPVLGFKTTMPESQGYPVTNLRIVSSRSFM